MRPPLWLPANREYTHRVLTARRDNLVIYLPLGESAGATAFDLSPRRNNGAYTGVRLGDRGIGDGRSSPYFDGSGDFCNIYSAGFDTAFNKAAGTVMAWLKIGAASVWTDATNRRAVTVRTDGSNQLSIARDVANHRLTLYGLGGALGYTYTTGPLGWVCVIGTWSTSANRLEIFVDAVSGGSGTFGTWSGNLGSTLCCIGSLNTTPAAVWSGWIAHVAIWDVVLRSDEIVRLSRWR